MKVNKYFVSAKFTNKDSKETQRFFVVEALTYEQAKTFAKVTLPKKLNDLLIEAI